MVAVCRFMSLIDCGPGWQLLPWAFSFHNYTSVGHRDFSKMLAFLKNSITACVVVVSSSFLM